jgi:hypothetical protein
MSSTLRSAHRKRTPSPSFVCSIRAECLDWLLILGHRHLESVLRIYTTHYTRERPHRGLACSRPTRQTPTRNRAAERSTAATNSAD